MNQSHPYRGAPGHVPGQVRPQRMPPHQTPPQQVPPGLPGQVPQWQTPPLPPSPQSAPPPPYGYPPHWQHPQQPQRVPVGVLVGVSLWRLLIVVFACTGFFAIVSDVGLGSAMPGLSQQASLFTALVYTGLLLYPAFTGGRRHEPDSPWLRGATAVLLLLVSVTFLTLMGGDVSETWSLFEHLLTPLVVLVDWIAVGRNQSAAAWWHPITWVGPPLAYLVYFLAADVGLYGGFLDPDDDAFVLTVFGFLAAVLFAGYLLYGCAKVKSLVSAGASSPQPPVRY